MSLELALALIASVISIINLIFFVVLWRKQKNVGVTSITLQAFAELERSIANVPSALRFHGITLEELKEIDITPEEFAYLVSSFSTGYIYHYGVTPKDIKPSTVDSYRYNLLRSPSTRKAWPLIKLMLGGGKYVDKMEATIRFIEEEEKKNLPGIPLT